MKNMDLFFMMPTTAFMTEEKKKFLPSTPVSNIYSPVLSTVSMDGYM